MRKTMLYSFLLALALASLPAWAQEEPRALFQVILVKPKPGPRTQYEAAAKAHIQWHKEQNDTWRWDVCEIITGENTGSYYAVAPNRRWQDYQERAEFVAQDQRHAEQTVGAHALSFRISFYEQRLDLSNPPAEMGPAPLFSLLEFRVRFGRTARFEHTVARINEAIKMTNWPRRYIWYMLANGGEHPTYALLFPHQSWADLEPPQKSFVAMLEEAYGRQEAQNLLEALGESVAYERSEIFVYRPELSYVPSGQP